MHRVAAFFAWPLLAAWFALSGAGPAAADAGGQRIYRDGVLPSGQPLQATVGPAARLSGADAACAKCHQRSGLGSSEGPYTIRPIAGRLLFSLPAPRQNAWPAGVSSADTVSAERPAYTRDTLARALRDGIDSAGRPLDPLMPRYALSDVEIAELHAYLDTLSREPAPGVSDTEIHFATIVAPGASAEKSRAMLEVLQAFVRDKNGGTRLETRRRAVGREQMYRAFRSWVLHPWTLDGPPETWHEQLTAHYRRQPVFAVIGGTGGGSWAPVHAFCQSFEIPCIFPDVDYPVVADTDFYALYFSRGVTLEAEVLARHLLDSGARGPVVQVYRDTPLGRLPAQALRTALQAGGGPSVVDIPLAGVGRLPEALTQRAGHGGADVLALWLDAADATRLAAADLPDAQAIYVSASLLGMRRPDFPAAWQDRLRMVTPFDLPQSLERRLGRMHAWMRARKIPPGDARTQANAFFAASITGDVVSHLGENFSRDYFIEGIEQMTQSVVSTSIYPHLSLGPGQRFASKGGYVVGFPAGMGNTPVVIGEWLVP